MKHSKKLGLLYIFLMLFLWGCSHIPQETAPSSSVTTAPPLTAVQQYTKACAAVREAENLLLNYSVSQERSVNGASYSKSISGTATFQNIRQDSMTAIVEETLTYGTYENTYEELYCNQAAYVLVDNCVFSAQLSASDFVNRQIPAILMDESLYASIVAAPSEAGTTLTFSQPIGLERWLSPGENTTFISASGTATLDSSGNLTQSSYRATYLWQDVEYVYEASVKVTVPKALDLSGRHPNHFQDASPISDIRIPKLLMQVVGDVYSSQVLSCDATEAIYSEAIPLSQNRQSLFRLSGASAALHANMEHTITLSDYRSDVSTSTQAYLFQNGQFTSSINGSAPTVQPQITAQQVRQSCEDAILSALFATKYISGATLLEDVGRYRLELSGNESFVSDLMVGITQFLTVDLDSQADTALTREAGGYVVIDMATGLPTAMGLSLHREHTVNTVPYQLTYRLEHTLLLSGMAS